MMTESHGNQYPLETPRNSLLLEIKSHGEQRLMGPQQRLLSSIRSLFNTQRITTPVGISMCVQIIIIRSQPMLQQPSITMLQSHLAHR